ncbi:SAM-dependent methyltransferase [Magnetovirga frankeli]|nr:SAM-dependent methyltransferase [gamma proteobacterium SS-5]
MQEDFLDAHRRHLSDAGYLFQAERWANADHLYGISAECGLKVLIEKLKGSSLDRGDRLHVMEEKKPNNAWLKYQTYLSGHAKAAKLALPTLNPFADWLVSQRYANQSNFDHVRVQSHQEGAKAVAALLKKDAVEGFK